MHFLLLLIPLFLSCAEARSLSLGEARSFPEPGIAPSTILLEDLDGDSTPNLLIADRLGGTIHWIEDGGGAGCFGEPRLIEASGEEVYALAVADLDGDGDLDVLKASTDVDKVAWFENTDGQGSFGPEQVLSLAVNGARAVHAADLDGDGDVDVVCLGYEGDQVGWFQNLDGAGSFSALQLLAVAPDAPHGLDSADLDGDGDLDLAVASHHDNSVRWLENLGSATAFSEHLVDAQVGGAVSVRCADLSGDELPDLLVAGYNAGAVYLLLNDAGQPGQFAGGPIAAGLVQPITAQAADLDGDGDLDVAALSHEDGLSHWYRNVNGTGVGWEEEEAHWMLGSPGLDMALGDLNGDSVIDVALALEEGVCWQDGRGRSTWERAWVNWVLRSIRFDTLRTGDVDGDGDADLMVYDTHSDELLWLENLLSEMGWSTGQALAVNLEVSRGPAWADMDGDGLSDLLLTDNRANEWRRPVWIRNLDGQGGYACEAMPVVEDYTRLLYPQAGDLDGDGDMDLVCSMTAEDNWQNWQLLWYENGDGSGTNWLAHSLSFGFLDARRPALCDADQDGDLDILAYYGDPRYLSIRHNLDGQGSFSAEQWLFGAIESCLFPPVDLDGDTTPDVLLKDLGLRVGFLSLGEEDYTPITEPDEVDLVRPCDFDGDGDLDLLASTSDRDSLIVYENALGDGSEWQRHSLAGLPFTIRELEALDKDGDGLPEAVVGGYGIDKAWLPKTSRHGPGLGLSIIGNDVLLEWDGSPEQVYHLHAAASLPELAAESSRIRSVSGGSLLLRDERRLGRRFYRLVESEDALP